MALSLVSSYQDLTVNIVKKDYTAESGLKIGLVETTHSRDKRVVMSTKQTTYTKSGYSRKFFYLANPDGKASRANRFPVQWQPKNDVSGVHAIDFYGGASIKAYGSVDANLGIRIDGVVMENLALNISEHFRLDFQEASISIGKLNKKPSLPKISMPLVKDLLKSKKSYSRGTHTTLVETKIQGLDDEPIYRCFEAFTPKGRCLLKMSYSKTGEVLMQFDCQSDSSVWFCDSNLDGFFDYLVVQFSDPNSGELFHIGDGQNVRPLTPTLFNELRGLGWDGLYLVRKIENKEDFFQKRYLEIHGVTKD